MAALAETGTDVALPDYGARLREATLRQRLARLAQAAPICLFDMRIEPGVAPRIDFLSARAEHILGPMRTEIMQRPEAFWSLLHPADLPGLRAALSDPCRGDGRLRHRLRLLTPGSGPEGRMFLLDATASPGPGAARVWTGALIDLSGDIARNHALHAARQEAEISRLGLEFSAGRDRLTGLPDRRAFERTLDQRAGDGPVQVLRLDLHGFRRLNDRHGRAAGDMVLIHAAELLRRAVRPGDAVARVGGDAFAVALAGGHGRETAALDLAQAIRAALDRPFLWQGRRLRLGAAIGVAGTGGGRRGPRDCARMAELALHRAKASGSDEVAVFTPALHRAVLKDRRIADELDAALRRREFVPHFQIQVCARDHRPTGAEVLARWHHPRRGTLSPAAFLDAAARNGIEAEIDAALLTATLGQLDRWRGTGFTPPKLSFNVSAGRLSDHRLLDTAKAARRYGTSFSLELLETVLIEEATDAQLAQIAALRRAGVTIEIDDFGTGHASIRGLMRLRPDRLKIDRHMVAPLGSRPEARRLLAAVVEMARALSISTVAEGVESAEQAAILADLGVDTLQGFLFAPPLPAPAFRALWKTEISAAQAGR